MDNKNLKIMRHSLAHIMAVAVRELWPGVKFAIGPIIENGFYYDFDFGDKKVSEDDLGKIEKKMKHIIKQNLKFEKSEISTDKGIVKEKKSKQIYKEELTKDLKKEGEKKVVYYKLGDFEDLCRGPHISSSGKIKTGTFKLTKLAGAYWRGDEEKKMLTRIYGVAFASKKELDKYLEMMAEAEKRDHRKLGKEMDLFSFHEEARGFVFWHAKGMILRNALVKPYNQLHKEAGYDLISTPILLDEKIWRQSGHWDSYKDSMYFTKIDNKVYAIKPMNCPGSIIVYNTRPRSYKEFPIRFAEQGEVHRHEPSGTLHGLFRVRAFRQDDAHIFTREDQVEDEIKKVVKLTLKFYEIFNFSDVEIEISTRPEKSIGSTKIWNKSEAIMKKVLKDLSLNYRLNEGDGAFYGPKIDFHIKDSLGRSWQCGTVQLDFSMPERFDLKYVDKDGLFKRPVMIHRTIFGSTQRFVGILIEHYAGAFPVWLSPVQVKIISVGEGHIKYCKKLAQEFKEEGIRVEVDDHNETVGNKIRKAIQEKTPYVLVIGDKEIKSGKLAVRDRGKKETRAVEKDKFIKEVRKKIMSRK